MTFTLSPVIAHRGDRKFAPENTLYAFRQAARKGARWVEFDATLTRDTNQPVVIFHDDEVGRTTNLPNKPITAVSFNDLRNADAGSWFSESFAGEKVPTLIEAIELCDKLGLSMNIKIKVTSNGDRESPEPFDERLAALTAQRVVEDVIKARSGNWDNILLSSFSTAALLKALELAPEAPRGYRVHKLWPDDNFDDKLPDFSQRVGRIKPSTVNFNQELLSSPQRVDRFKAVIARTLGHHVPMLAYTVNDPIRYSKLLEWGVVGVSTDMPGELLNPTQHSAHESY